jgi:hypothetical protein
MDDHHFSCITKMGAFFNFLFSLGCFLDLAAEKIKLSGVFFFAKSVNKSELWELGRIFFHGFWQLRKSKLGKSFCKSV